MFRSLCKYVKNPPLCMYVCILCPNAAMLAVFPFRDIETERVDIF